MIDYKQLAHDIAAPYAVEHQPTIEDGRCTVDVHVHYMVRRESDAAHDWRHAEIEIESIEINGVHTKPDGLEAEFLAELERWAKDHEGIR